MRTDLALDLRDVFFAWAGSSGFSLAVDSLSVKRGERLMLVGPSGGGKSTLLSLVCGVVAPQRGEIWIDGAPFSSLSPAARDRARAEKLGVVFQAFNLLPYATPLENVLLPLSFAPDRRKRVGAAPEQEAVRLLTALGLPQSVLRAAQASALSVGQQQRVAVARALIGGPRLVIADEPTSALDAASQRAFLDLLFAQLDETGASLVMVSHDERLGAGFDRVESLADLAAARRDGEVA